MIPVATYGQEHYHGGHRGSTEVMGLSFYKFLCPLCVAVSSVVAQYCRDI